MFDGFFLRIKIAFFFALIGTCPVWLYQLSASSRPGCAPREEVGLPVPTFTAVPLFVGGAVRVVMDRGLHYLLNLAPQNSLVLPKLNPGLPPDVSG